MSEERTTFQDRHPNFRGAQGQLFLVRCFRCDPVRGRENHISGVAVGVCASCGWSEPEHDDAREETHD